HFYCTEEVRLNRRLAPDIYLDVIAVTGLLEHPIISGTGTPIEYAVKMHAFEQRDIWSDRIRHQLLAANDVDQLAHKIARFHQDVAQAPIESHWGSLATL